MKKKTGIIITCIIIAVIIIGVIVFKISLSIKQENEEQQKNMQTINENFHNLNELAEKFNNSKKEFEQIYSQTFLNTLVAQNDTFIQILKEYDKTLKQITEIAQNIEKICQKDYKDGEITKDCNTIKKTSKSATEVFEKDKETYNNLIDNYNAWVQENNNENPQLTKYERITEE